MDENQRAANLEFWSDRSRDSAADEAPRPHKPYRHSRFGRLSSRLPEIRVPKIRVPSIRGPRIRIPNVGSGEGGRGRARPVAAAVLLAGLAGAWLLVGHQSHGAAAVAPLPPVVPSVVQPSFDVRPVPPTTVGAAGTAPAVPANAIALPPIDTTLCTGLSRLRPHVRCVNAYRLMKEVALYTPASVGPAFRLIAGAPAAPGSGPAACAAGKPDQRAWSIPAAPQYAVGRYVCRLEAGRAAMWWTHGDRLVHVLANDGNLAALFSWWSAHPSE